MLDVLQRHGARATFFCIGQNAEQFPDLVRAIVDAGHELGNHTMTHPNLHDAMPHRLRREIVQCSDVLSRTAGVPIRLFRAPYGHFRWDVVPACRSAGVERLVGWNLAVAPEKGMLGDAVKTLTQQAAGGSIVLLHDGRWDEAPDRCRVIAEATAVVLEQAIPLLRKRGLTFETIGHELWRGS